MAHTGRSENEFVSVDSAPRRFSQPAPLWKAPAFLLVFSVVSLGLLFVLDRTSFGQSYFYGGDFVSVPMDGARSVPLRAFVLAHMFSFACFAVGSLRNRFLLGVDMVATFLAVCIVLDLVTLLLGMVTGLRMSFVALEILSGFVGYAVFAFKLLERGRMPSRIEVTSVVRHPRRMLATLLGAGLLSGALSSYIVEALPNVLDAARSVALLGGIGPGVFLFLPLVFLFLYIAAHVDSVIRDLGPFAPPLTIIVPAHNEEYIIARTIRCIDDAAEQYGGSVTILIMNNNSSDQTAQVAQEALDACLHAGGSVIAVPKPGKSHALNAALDATETAFVIRIDADTQVAPAALQRAMRRMKDPAVGVVGGLPVPPGGGPFDGARMLELIVKHGFYSVSLGTINSVVGVPGMFAAYQTELPRRLGGFVEGMNGEDTDMSMRIGELGYRLIVDPRIRYISEVPVTFRHMREQRLRWFRSVFHISARCRDMIYGPAPTLRGKIMLPFMLLNSSLRAMMAPMLLFALIVWAAPGIDDRDLEFQAALAVLIGAPALVAVLAAALNREYKAILHLPAYLGFRLIRAYFTLESNFTISIRGYGGHLYSTTGRSRPVGKPDRLA